MMRERGPSGLLSALLLLVAACDFEHGVAGGNEAGIGPGEAGGSSNPEAGVDHPEAGATCMSGLGCDDMNACTELDTCVAGECRGIDDLCPANCANSCFACGGDTCCHQTCPTGSTCPICPAGCSCDLSCGSSRPCMPVCSSGASCRFKGTGSETDGNYSITCQSGSSCVVDCVGDEGNCVVTCEATAACLLIDHIADGSTTLLCPTGAVTCPAPNQNTQVCNRPCP